ncbi:unnamed protein product [Cylindrotheca closterium]|uniref:SAP domain-containing protein n=1 Tax=Cylindrotheca closterium TaxID=2856 RepID=A0AAD2JNE2_9STRA|nr:unnamed protein product [Cylindrotheca closterium]
MNILNSVLLLSTLLRAHGLLPNKQINGQNMGVSCNNRNQRTQLFVNLWQRMEIEEDEEPMWYVINCVAGLELDLLRQCKQASEDMDDVVKLVVPMQTSHRSHGANRMVTDVKVKYQGYVFGKLRLTEETYSAIQGLDLCRSWMGTVNQRGHKKLPPAPLPLNEDEIENFGLENIEELDEEEKEEDIIVDAGDDNEDKEAAAIEEVVQTVYKGLRVGDMIKVTAKNKFFDEDGIVRRLKDNKIFLRFYTYGTMFEEWLDPSEVRKLSDEEVLKGLGGPSAPITQRDIDGPDNRDRNDYGENRGDQRRNLQNTMGVAPGQRNRRQDRNEQRFSRGNSLQDQDQERKNWDWYKDNERKGQGGAYSDGKTDIRGASRSSNTEGDVDAQWGRPQQPRQNNKQANSGDEWSKFVSNANNSAKKQDTDDFFDSLYNDLSNELENENSGVGQSNDGGDGEDFFGWLMDEIEDDESSKANKAPKAAKPGDEDDFFASLEMELQEDKPPKKKANKKTSPPSDESLDDFFADLASFDGDHDKSGGRPSRAPAAAKGDADDFFANLEAELETELTTTLPPASAKGPNQGVANDFFADLEQELDAELQIEPTSTLTKASDRASVDDFFADLQSELGEESDGFFAELEDVAVAAATDVDVDEMKVEPAVVAPTMTATTIEEAPAAPTQSSGSSLDPTSLQKMTVPVLKDMLRDRGLKVSGKKADLIERLVS